MHSIAQLEVQRGAASSNWLGDTDVKLRVQARLVGSSFFLLFGSKLCMYICIRFFFSAEIFGNRSKTGVSITHREKWFFLNNWNLNCEKDHIRCLCTLTQRRFYRSGSRCYNTSWAREIELSHAHYIFCLDTVPALYFFVWIFTVSTGGPFAARSKKGDAWPRGLDPTTSTGVYSELTTASSSA